MNDSKIKLQFVAHLKSSKIAWDMDMKNFISSVRSGVYINGKTTIDIRSKIKKMRSLDRSIKSESLEYDATKKKLPGVLVHGLFDGQRGSEFFNKTYSGIVGIDIDPKGKVDIEEVKARTIEYLGKNSFAITLSPGGNGLHVYLSAKVETEEQIAEVQNNVKIKTGLSVDTIVKDVSRLFCCTLDPDVWINENPEPYEYTSLQPGAEKSGSGFSDIEILLIEKGFLGKAKYSDNNTIYKAFLLLAKHFEKDYVESYLKEEKNRIRLFDPKSGNINATKKNQDSLDNAYEQVEKWTDKFVKYFMTGTGIFKEVISDLGEEKIHVINQQLFFSRFGKDSIFKIRKYDGFGNIPNNFPGIENVDYERVPDHLYNLYCPLQNKPVAGSWDSIRAIFEHLFTSQVQYLYDYTKLLLTKPAEILPILVLISPERATGKTTFLNLMREIFNPMAAIISMMDYSSRFNAHYVSKLVVAIDESHLDKKELEKIKSQATALQTSCEFKGKDVQMIRNFQKFILASNSLDFTYVDKLENRFWTFQINKLTKSNPGLYKKALSEIPGFIHYLINDHEMIVPEKLSRQWFPDNIVTKDFRGNLYEKVKQPFLLRLYDRCQVWFVDNPDETEIRFSLQDVHVFYKIYLPASALCEMLMNEDWINRYDNRRQYNINFLNGEPDQKPVVIPMAESQLSARNDKRRNLFCVVKKDVIDYEIEDNEAF